MKKNTNKEKAKSLMNEFKQFISRGNVLDLAVGVIIGGAFGKIVTSLVNDIIMPLIGIIIGGKSFESLNFKIEDSVIQYGMFIQNIVDFLIVAFCIFIFIKIINKFMHKKEEKKQEEKKPEEKPNDIKILEEIRDILKAEKDKNKKTK